MPDESQMPNGWEMQRAVDGLNNSLRDGLAQINARLDRLVSQDAFEAERRRVDERLAALGADVVEEKTDRLSAVESEKQAREQGDKIQQSQLDKLGNRIWGAVVGALIPIGLFIADIAIRKGH